MNVRTLTSIWNLTVTAACDAVALFFEPLAELKQLLLDWAAAPRSHESPSDLKRAVEVLVGLALTSPLENGDQDSKLVEVNKLLSSASKFARDTTLVVTRIEHGKVTMIFAAQEGPLPNKALVNRVLRILNHKKPSGRRIRFKRPELVRPLHGYRIRMIVGDRGRGYQETSTFAKSH